eukprot:5024548-Prymnesium_polylepis.3
MGGALDAGTLGRHASEPVLAADAALLAARRVLAERGGAQPLAGDEPVGCAQDPAQHAGPHGSVEPPLTRPVVVRVDGREVRPMDWEQRPYQPH